MTSSKKRQQEKSPTIIFKRALLTTAVVLTGLQCQAWLLFEPFIGYNKGQEQSTIVQGIGLGARIGVDLRDLFVAADIDYNDLQQGTLSSVKYTDTGLTIGGRIQRTRLWYGVITSSQLAYPSGAVTITSKGSGSKIGLGSEITGKLNLNLELRSINFTSNDPGTGVTTPITEVATVGFLSLSWIL